MYFALKKFKLEQDIIKSKIQYVEKTIDHIIKQNQKELKQKKNSIIADLQKNEKDLLEKVGQNPRLWTSESLKISLEMTRNTPALITSDVSITKKLNLEKFPSIINVSVKSNHPRDKKWTEANLSGSYSIIEMVNNRPAYKVK